MILNRHASFDKGVNKILKMITMLPQSPESIAAFIMERFPGGMLTFTNLMSLFNYLSKVAQEPETEQGSNAITILQALV